MPVHRRLLVPVLAAALAATAAAQSTVCPGAFASARGSGGANTLTRDAGNPRTYLLGIAASELGAIAVGDTIQGVSFRAGFANNPASWPPSDAVWLNYDVSVGPAQPLAGWTTTFAGNFASPPQLVRSGPMLITAGTFSNNSALPSPQPNAWGEFYWDFQHAYVYQGGDLALLFTHTGSNLSGSALYIDYQTVATTAVAYTASSYQAATGSRIGSPAIARIHYGYGAGCAGSGGLVPNLVQDANLSGGLGGTILLSVGNAPANAPCLFVFGLGRLQVPLPNGCSLLTAPAASLLALCDGNGRGRLPIQVPAGVVGRINAQVVVLDNGAPLGFTASNGVEPRAN